MTVVYEWDVETVADRDSDDFADGDVIEHYHTASFKECMEYVNKYPPEAGTRYDIVLVRDDDEGRSWAYLFHGNMLPFLDAYNNNVCKVPKRFITEVTKYLSKS